MVSRFAGTPVAPRFGGSSLDTIASNAAKAFGGTLGGRTAPRVNQNASLQRTSPAASTSFSAPRMSSWNSEGWSPSSTIGAMAAFERQSRGLPNQNLKYPGQGVGGGGAGAPASYKPGFGRFTPDVDAEINAAANRFGVPANFLKTIIAKESSGDWQNNSRPVWVASHGGYIHGYVGVFDFAASRSGISFQEAMGNRAKQIEMLAGVLRSQYDQVKGKNPAYNWLNVAALHYSGDPSGNTNPPGWERNGTTRDYMNKTAEWWQSLEPNANLAGGGGPAGQVGGPISPGAPSQGLGAIWAGTGANPSLNYGFLAPNNLGLYGYGTAYGTDGRGHTGIDAGMPLGTPNYSPVSGRVVCACTGSGGGCAAFNDVMGRGCGRIEVELDNGHRLILGHMSTTSVQLGQRVTPGMQLGTSGGMNGPHTHIEYRIPDQSQSSGFRLVDPAKYLGTAAGNAGGVPSTGAPAPQAPAQPMFNWQRPLQRQAQAVIGNWRR